MNLNTTRPGGDSSAFSHAPTSRPTSANTLVEMVERLFVLGTTVDGRHVAIERAGPNLAHLLDGSFRQRLRLLHWRRSGEAIAGQTLDTVVDICRAIASDSAPLAVFLRLGRHGNGVVLDLGSPDGEAVVVEGGSWSVVGRSPVTFLRTPRSGALPLPDPECSMDDGLAALRNVLAVSETQWGLLLGWIISTMRGVGARAGLLLTGPPGAAKTSRARSASRLIDPVSSGIAFQTLSLFKDSDAAVVAAGARAVLAVDNVSTLPGGLSDLLCQLATGGSQVKRRHHSNDEAVVLDFRRPVILTGIAPRLNPDLLDRLVPIALPMMTSRKTDEEVEQEFNKAWPLALAGVLHLLAAVEARLERGTRAANPGRLADFSNVLAAMDEVLGTDALAAYLDSGEDHAIAGVEGSPVLLALMTFLEASGGTHTGSLASLLEDLKRIETDSARKDNPYASASFKSWPTTPRGLGMVLREHQVDLSRVGVRFETYKGSGQTKIRLWTVDEGPDGPPSSTATSTAEGSTSTGFEPSSTGPWPQRPSSGLCGAQTVDEVDENPGVSYALEETYKERPGSTSTPSTDGVSSPSARVATPAGMNGPSDPSGPGAATARRASIGPADCPECQRVGFGHIVCVNHGGTR